MKFRKNNIPKWVFCLLALLPLLLVLLKTFSIGEYDLTAFESSLHDITTIGFLNDLNNFIFGTFLSNTNNIYLHIFVDYFSYLLLISMLYLFYYAILGIIALIEKAVDMMRGE